MSQSQPHVDLTTSCLSAVIVPRTTSTRDMTALETAMQGLAYDAAHPIALEVAATATSRHFLLRATTPIALMHLEDQVRARYPQATIEPVQGDDDPLRLRAGAVASALELAPGAAAYLPLRAFSEREFLKEGADPLLGTLAVFNHLPPKMRIVVQLALMPAAATWSRAYQRKAVEHPLEQERQQLQQQSKGTAGPGLGKLLGLLVLVVVALLWLRFKRQITVFIPPWLFQALIAIVHGKDPRLSSGQLTLVALGGIGLFAVSFAIAFLALQLANRQPSIYNMRQVEERTARVAYWVRLRFFAITPTSQDQATDPAQLRELRQAQRELLASLVATYRQYHLAAGGYFVPKRLSERKLHHLLDQRSTRGWLCSGARGWAYDLKRSRHLLSVADIAALWHLPQAQDLADVPYVERGRARTRLAPPLLAAGNGWKIGVSEHGGQRLSVLLPAECLRHNLLAVASTGKGKSTLFLHLAQAALAAPETLDGLVVIEPHGDLIQALLGSIPSARKEAVVLVDLANREHPVGINPLDMLLGHDRDKAVDNLITLFEQLWAGSYGTRTENILEYAMKTLAAANETLVERDPEHGPDKQYTLLDVVPLLRRKSFRHAVFEQVTDETLLEWWQTYYEPLDQRLQSEITSSVITKMSKFASSRIARRILGQPRSSLDLGEVIRQGKILLVSTASGEVGADLSELVGNTLLGLLQTAFSEQAVLPEARRQRFLVLVDEFQVYRGANYQTLLAELRKYGGSFGLATQSLSYLDRLERTLRSTVLANIDHLFAFTMAGEDARLLRELEGVDEGDITNLDDFTCYVKLSVGGRRLPVFSLRLDLPPSSDPEQARCIRQASQDRYARPVSTVEELLKQARTRQRYAAPTTAKKGDQQAMDQDFSEAGAPGGKALERTSNGRKKQGRNGAGSGKHPAQERYGLESGKKRDAPTEELGPGVMSRPLHLMYGEDADEQGEMER